jgi:hypothetical protein
MNETTILQSVRLAASKHGVVLSRNNCGSLLDVNGRLVRFGLFSPGGADLIGFRTINSIAQFVALEIKMPGKKPTPEQQHFIDMVNKSGGIGAVVTDPDQLENIFVDTK